MATSILDLQELISPVVTQKTYYEVMPGKLFKSFIRAMVGLEKDQEDSIDVHNLPLKYHKGLYLAPKNYTSCQPLPQEWLQHIPNVKKYNREISTLVNKGIFENE